MTTPVTSPILVDQQPVELRADNLTEIRQALDIPNATPDTEFRVEESDARIRHQTIKIVPNTVALAYYRGTIAAVAAVDTVLYLHALGGRYEARSLRPHRVEHIIVDGVDQRCAVTVRAGTAYCGPIWCAPKRRDALLATLPYLAMRGGPRWCSPVDAHGAYRCAACDQKFPTAAALFDHGGIPRVQHESFTNPRFVIPLNWRPLPAAVTVAPVAAHNYAEGTLADRRESRTRQYSTDGQHRTANLKARLSTLERRHGGRYVPYVLRRVYR